MSLPIFPALGTPNVLKEFRCYSQMVLPTIYSDALSYYEDIGKMVKKLNEVIEQGNEFAEELGKIVVWLEGIKQYLDEREIKVDSDIQRLVETDESFAGQLSALNNNLSSRLDAIESVLKEEGRLLTFNTTASLRDYEGRLTIGTVCKTLGYYDEYDGGGYSYVVGEYEGSNILPFFINNDYNQVTLIPMYYNVPPTTPKQCGIFPWESDYAERNTTILSKLVDGSYIRSLDLGTEDYYFSGADITSDYLELKNGTIILVGDHSKFACAAITTLTNITFGSEGDNCAVECGGTLNNCVFDGGYSEPFNVVINTICDINKCRFLDLSVEVSVDCYFNNCRFNTSRSACVRLRKNDGKLGFFNCEFDNFGDYVESVVLLPNIVKSASIDVIGCYGNLVYVVNTSVRDTGGDLSLNILYDSDIAIDEGLVTNPYPYDIAGVANFNGLCYGIGEGGELPATYEGFVINGLRQSGNTEVIYYHPFNGQQDEQAPEQITTLLNVDYGKIVSNIGTNGLIRNVRIESLDGGSLYYDYVENIREPFRVKGPCRITVYFEEGVVDEECYVTAIIR